MDVRCRNFPYTSYFLETRVIALHDVEGEVVFPRSDFCAIFGAAEVFENFLRFSGASRLDEGLSTEVVQGFRIF